MSIGKTVWQVNPKVIKPTESVRGAEIKIAEIRRVMEKYGWFDGSAVVVEDEADGTIFLLDGHHRLAAALELGMREIPVVIAEFLELPEFYLYYNSMEAIRRAAEKVKKSR